jgi:glutathione peroxidase
MSRFYDFEIEGIEGRPIRFGNYRGHAVLVVNVASRCGYTPQYHGLEALYVRHRDRGFSLLGVPCNQFGGQEPEAEPEILAFCRDRYHVTFPLTRKMEVNGISRHALFAWLVDSQQGFPGDIRWNFEKFLVNSQGRLIARFPSEVEPATLEEEVLHALPPADPSPNGLQP